MADFDPTQPAILHDVLNDRIVTWDWEKHADFNKNALVHADGHVAWDGQVFDGWGNVLGG